MNGENIANGIAVIGMACRFPGAGDKDIFWENLKTGVESITCFSDQELEDAGIPREIFNQPDYVRKGFIIEDEDKFDASFFGYSPREAKGMDPQHRLFLETAWKALEDGGYPPGEYDGAVGMFAGSKISTYLLNLLDERKSLYGAAAGYQTLIGNDKDYLVTRASYKLNLKGPSVAIQSACSTSLVAVHFACESVLSGECDMALAGGVSISVPQKAGYVYQEGMVLSPDGHCRAFDENARGMVPGNGVGVVLLKDLEKALLDNDHIYAVVRGTAVNNDGANKTGYTAPSLEGQSKAIREAIAIAGVDCESISYVETHGTGTELGDPIEIESLSEVFRSETDKKGYCAIGSVKPNIGHLDTAAGIASFIKTVLSLQHGQIPPSLNFLKPNPKIDFDVSPFFVNTQLTEWQANGTPNRAGVSSFGFGGTNAHAILEQAPERDFKEQKLTYPFHLLTLSAKTPEALIQQIRNYNSFLDGNKVSIDDVCFTANSGRPDFPYRFAAIADSTEDLQVQLSAALQGEASSIRFEGVAEDRAAPAVSFDLSGQSGETDLLTDICSEAHGLKSQYRLPLAKADSNSFRLMLTALGNLYVRGAKIDWDTFYQDGNPCRIPLPTYPFLGKRHWHEKQIRYPEASPFVGDPNGSTMPFSGRQLSCAVPVFQFEVSLSSCPFLNDHQIHGKTMIPVGVFWEMATAAGRAHFKTNHFNLKNMSQQEAMLISEDQPALKVQILLEPGGPGNQNAGFKIFCKDETRDPSGENWEQYVSGEICVESVSTDVTVLDDAKNKCEHAYEIPQFISDLYALEGIIGDETEKPWQFGEVWTSDNDALAKVTFIDRFFSEAETCQLHPSIFEPCIQTMFAIPLSQEDDTVRNKIFLPIGFDRINYVSAISKELWCHVSIHSGKNWCDSDFTADFQLFDEQGNIVAQMLGAYMRQASASAFLKDKERSPCYRIQWQKAELEMLTQKKSGSSMSRCLFVLADQEGAAEELVQCIRADGGAWAILRPDGNLRIHDKDTEYEEKINIDTAPIQEAFELIFKEKLAERGLQCNTVVQCRGINSRTTEEATSEEIGDSVFSAYWTIVSLLRAIVSSGHNVNDLCLLTQGAQAVTENDVTDVLQTPLWGMRKCLEKEHPELNVRIFDLDGSDTPGQMHSIWELLHSGSIEREIVLRDKDLFVPRLVRLDASRDGLPPAQEEPDIDSEATYLITGGFGGVGMETAVWLAGHGAKYLVLLGRNNQDSKARATIDALRATGVQILTPKADVTDFNALSKVLSDVRDAMPPLKGVFHLAGILGEGDMLRQDPDIVKTIMAPKVGGAWNLHLATREDPLDFFVLFSSISSLWGGHGLGAYAGANSFLDALAHYRKTMELPALSINWGAFSQVGMIAEDQKGIRLREKFGVSSFPPSEALTYLDRVSGFSQVCISEMDWNRFFTQSDMKNDPFFSALVARYAGHEIKKEDDSDLLKELSAVSREERNHMLGNYLTRKVSEVLGIDADRLSMQEDLLQIGMDSLMFLTLAQTISSDLNINIVPHKLFENPTIEGLLAQFSGEIAFEADEDKDRNETFSIEPDPANRYEPFGLTDIQHAYWIGRSGVAELGDVACHVYFEIMTEALDLDRYTAAWQRVIDRHDMLRAIILPNGRQQVLASVPPFEIPATDLSQESPDGIELQRNLIREEMSHQVRPADQWPLFEVRGSILDDRRIVLHISIDILIADGYSIYNLMQEIFHYYHTPEFNLPPIECTFRDYVVSESNFRESETYRKSRQYWVENLPTLPPPPELALAKSPSELKETRFVRQEARLDTSVWEKLQSYASQSGLTRTNLLLAAYAEVLATWSKSRKFTLNLTFFHRLQGHSRINEVIGDFTSLTLLKVDADQGARFRERARQIQEQLWKDMEYRYFSGVRVLQEMSLGNPGSERTLMPVVFTSNLGYEKIRQESTGLALPGEVVYSISQTPQVWIDNQISEDNQGLVIIWDAVDDLFPDGMLDDMFNAYHSLLTRLADSYDAWNAGNFNLLPESQSAMRENYNATREPVSDRLLHTLFFDRAERNPGKEAVITTQKRMSYRELALRAGQIGQRLRSGGVKANELVAVVMDKGWEQIPAVLGILHSGAAYLPIDASAPRERIWHLLRDGDVRYVATQSWLETGMQWPDDVRCLAVDRFTPATESGWDEPDVVQTRDDLAYVIHTSGSTGLPKGVMIDHKGAVNTILDVNKRFHVTSEDTVFALSNLNFDLSVYDVFGTLAAGGTIVMPENSFKKDPHHWLSLMKQENVTLWNSVPALMQMLMEYVSGRPDLVPECLRVIMLSGDWIPIDLPGKIKSVFNGVEINSLGGATEASIWSIHYPVDEIDPQWKSIPYGRPMSNQSFYVLNKKMEICPDWVTGDLYIGGTGLSKGYWRDKEKTDASFITHPDTGLPLYRTGDLGRFLPDGNIEFLGREDQQVKINGYRIELGEIESALKQIGGITDAIVVILTDPKGNHHLAGHIICETEGRYIDRDLKEKLKQILPEYMVPSFYFFCNSFPVTANGKVDRKTLASIADVSFQTEGSDYVAPKNEAEQNICRILIDILGIENASTKTLFSDLGATSMHLVQLHNRLNETFEKNVAIADIFEYPTISSLAGFVNEKDKDNKSINRADRRIAMRRKSKNRKSLVVNQESK